MVQLLNLVVLNLAVPVLHNSGFAVSTGIPSRACFRFPQVLLSFLVIHSFHTVVGGIKSVIYDDSIIWLKKNSAVLESIDASYCSQPSQEHPLNYIDSIFKILFKMLWLSKFPIILFARFCQRKTSPGIFGNRLISVGQYSFKIISFPKQAYYIFVLFKHSSYMHANKH